MISFTNLGNMGRLGNQLFQYAALFSLARTNGYSFCIRNPKTKNHHGQICMLDRFNITANIDDEFIANQYYQEPTPWNYDSRFFSIPDNTDISGFFQSTWYFGKNTEEIKKELTPKSEYLEAARERLERIKAENGDCELVSLHLRRGDNTDNTDDEIAKQSSYGVGQRLDPMSFSGRYITNALSYFSDRKVKFLVFSGGSRNGNNDSDLEWCRKNFNQDRFIIAGSNDEMGDFCSIMSCDHNILCPISSFGWWAAYLNQNSTKKVVAPIRYHPGLEINYRPMFYPKEFILV